MLNRRQMFAGMFLPAIIRTPNLMMPIKVNRYPDIYSKPTIRIKSIRLIGRSYFTGYDWVDFMEGRASEIV